MRCSHLQQSEVAVVVLSEGGGGAACCDGAAALSQQCGLLGAQWGQEAVQAQPWPLREALPSGGGVVGGQRRQRSASVHGSRWRRPCFAVSFPQASVLHAVKISPSAWSWLPDGPGQAGIQRPARVV